MPCFTVPKSAIVSRTLEIPGMIDIPVIGSRVMGDNIHEQLMCALKEFAHYGVFPKQISCINGKIVTSHVSGDQENVRTIHLASDEHGINVTTPQFYIVDGDSFNVDISVENTDVAFVAENEMTLLMSLHISPQLLTDPRFASLRFRSQRTPVYKYDKRTESFQRKPNNVMMTKVKKLDNGMTLIVNSECHNTEDKNLRLGVFWIKPIDEKYMFVSFVSRNLIEMRRPWYQCDSKKTFIMPLMALKEGISVSGTGNSQSVDFLKQAICSFSEDLSPEEFPNDDIARESIEFSGANPHLWMIMENTCRRVRKVFVPEQGDYGTCRRFAFNRSVYDECDIEEKAETGVGTVRTFRFMNICSFANESVIKNDDDVSIFEDISFERLLMSLVGLENEISEEYFVHPKMLAISSAKTKDELKLAISRALLECMKHMRDIETDVEPFRTGAIARLLAQNKKSSPLDFMNGRTGCSFTDEIRLIKTLFDRPETVAPRVLARFGHIIGMSCASPHIRTKGRTNAIIGCQRCVRRSHVLASLVEAFDLQEKFDNYVPEVMDIMDDCRCTPSAIQMSFPIFKVGSKLKNIVSMYA